jgi:hypothetical protein
LVPAVHGENMVMAVKSVEKNTRKWVHFGAFLWPRESKSIALLVVPLGDKQPFWPPALRR